MKYLTGLNSEYMKKSIFLRLISLSFVVLVIFSSLCNLRIKEVISTIFAVSESDCLNGTNLTQGEKDECINTILPRMIAAYAPAQEKNKKDLAGLRQQLSNINKSITNIKNQLTKAEKDIKERSENLAYAKEIFNQKAISQYKSLRLYDPLLPFLTSSNASTAFREIAFRQRAADEDRKVMDKYVSDIVQLNKDKESFQKNEASLSSLQKQVAEKEKFLAGEVAKVDAYLAVITAKQQAFLAQKLESLGISRSAYNLKGGCTDDRNIDPGFSPRIAFFSFGVPNRIGLNQFGAKGRAEQGGQNYEQILKAYYNADITSGHSESTPIKVVGTNEFGQSFNDTWNIEEYVKHLYEMPTDWPMEALKAQAIAARSYALAYTNNGASSICPSQKCQVVKKELNSDAWKTAVEQTKGIVLTVGGQPIKAWFSSTHGGYAFNSGDIGWSQTSWTKRLVDSSSGISSFSDLFSNAYDKNSPIFYCDWGSRVSNNKTAWLRPEEIADIVNVILLAKADSSTQPHLSQTDKPNPESVDTWSVDRVKAELSSKSITPFNNISDISIGWDSGSGKTTTVNLSGDAGNQNIDGQEFKNYFNLRAPANIQIVGPLYNVEKR